MLKNRTKLTNNDIIKIRTGELWLNADQCLIKGVVDKKKMNKAVGEKEEEKEIEESEAAK
jgi:hypothetical protein